jgi:hypothetical protein
VTVVPLPASPCVRVRLGYTTNMGTDAGSRFFLSYSGSAPTGANCLTLGADVAGAWGTHLAPFVYAGTTLTEVDVLDIATDTGLSGTTVSSEAGEMSSAILPNNVATNIEYDILQRYRGGKPRMFLPAPDATALVSGDKYTPTFLADVQAGFVAFMNEIQGLTIGSMGTLQHVALSYYHLFQNVVNSSGRMRAAPKYRDTALVYPVTGYSAKAVVGSQRRRRTATTF